LFFREKTEILIAFRSHDIEQTEGLSINCPLGILFILWRGFQAFSSRLRNRLSSAWQNISLYHREKAESISATAAKINGEAIYDEMNLEFSKRYGNEVHPFVLHVSYSYTISRRLSKILA